MYFADVGLAAYLLGIEDVSQMRSHPLRGSLFENMVVADVRKGFTNSGRDPKMSFYRTEKGFEVDLIITQGTQVIPIEIKSSMTYGKNLIKNLETYCEADSSAANPILVYDGDEMKDIGTHGICAKNWRSLHLGGAAMA